MIKYLIEVILEIKKSGKIVYQERGLFLIKGNEVSEVSE